MKKILAIAAVAALTAGVSAYAANPFSDVTPSDWAYQAVVDLSEQGVVEAYIHSNHKVGVLIEVACESDFVAKNEDFRSFVRDLCMHIAAASPICIKREEVPAELIEKEREIALAQMAEDKKPEAIKQKIVDGKIDKFISGVALLEQPFVKDDKMTINQLLTQKIATIGEKIEIKRFTRYQI